MANRGSEKLSEILRRSMPSMEQGIGSPAVQVPPCLAGAFMHHKSTVENLEGCESRAAGAADLTPVLAQQLA